MCGIIGYAGKNQAAPFILDGLAKLEYRGYDSAGVAVVGSDGNLAIEKCKGRLQVLKDKTQGGELIKGSVGIGHTRWATHGEPSDINAHPHISMNGKVALVHNGIIENYIDLKKTLSENGYEFKSDTDTEVVADILDFYYKGNPLETIQKVIKMLRGSYTLVIIFEGITDRIYSVRKNTPLIAGLGKTGNFVASDIAALVSHTKDMYLLEDDEIAEVSSEKINIYDINLNPIKKDIFKVDWDINSAEKEGYDHFMLKEIHEQPRAVRDTISSRIDENNEIILDNINLDYDYLKDVDRVYILGCGSAYYVGTAAKYAIEKSCGIPVEVDLASEFRYRFGENIRKMNPNFKGAKRESRVNKNTLVILISQSGETADTIAALREVKKYGARTLSIVNVVGSTIARESDDVIYTRAGQEVAVATTKALTSQLSVVFLLAEYMARKMGFVPDADLLDALKKIPEQIEELNKSEGKIKSYAERFKAAEVAFFLGRGIDYPVALEGALKLKETAYIHAEAYAAGELKHGPISLIEDGTLVIAVATQDDLYEKMISNIQEVKSRGAQVLIITNEGNDSAEEAGDIVYYVPKTHQLLTPLLSVIPLQQFGYYSAVMRGCDVDKPRNLAKSVVVE
ncbi:MAG: glutamine--fructose-6-phosphate transaminase (isomerizing) [Clostridia bacterium]|nr:glutamine--fructose-6-phosphate transaminase (isomerizing) [Clostridia bacterium]